jgi:hypothetical protein
MADQLESLKCDGCKDKYILEHQRAIFQQRVQAACAAVPLSILVGCFILDGVSQITGLFAFRPADYLVTTLTSAVSAVVTYFFAQSVRSSRNRKRLTKAEPTPKI